AGERRWIPVLKVRPVDKVVVVRGLVGFDLSIETGRAENQILLQLLRVLLELSIQNRGRRTGSCRTEGCFVRQVRGQAGGLKFLGQEERTAHVNALHRDAV